MKTAAVASASETPAAVEAENHARFHHSNAASAASLRSWGTARTRSATRAARRIG